MFANPIIYKLKDQPSTPKEPYLILLEAWANINAEDSKQQKLGEVR